MLTERNKNKFGESPDEILNRCLRKDDFADWNEWRDNNKIGYISFQGKKEALKRFASGRGIFKTWSQEFVEAYLECGLLEKDSETAILKCDPELEAQIFESIPLDVWKYADKVSCPVLAIRGELSDTFRVDAAERLKRKIANCELETIANAGHFVPMGKPKECARAITDFIKRN